MNWHCLHRPNIASFFKLNFNLHQTTMPREGISTMAFTAACFTSDASGVYLCESVSLFASVTRDASRVVDLGVSTALHLRSGPSLADQWAMCPSTRHCRVLLSYTSQWVLFPCIKSIGSASLHKSMDPVSLWTSMGTTPCISQWALHPCTSQALHPWTTEWELLPCTGGQFSLT